MLKTTISRKYSSIPDIKNTVNGCIANLNSSGEFLFENKRNTIKLFHMEKIGLDLVVKRYSNKWVDRRLIKAGLKKSKAQKAFENGLLLEKVNISTPSPVAYVEERNGKHLISCYYIYLYTEDVSITPLIEQATPDAEAVKALAAIIARLHENGIVHHDINLSNVLYHNDNGKLEFSLIDINRMTHTGSGLKENDMNVYLDDLVRFTGRLDVFLAVAYEYARIRGFEAEPFVRKLTIKKIRHDANWTRRKKLHRLFH